MPDGSPWGHSPTLGLDLCRTEEILRFYDRAAGQYLPTRREQAEALRVSANARRAAETAYQQEAEARLAAEAEAAELREQLRRMRGE